MGEWFNQLKLNGFKFLMAAGKSKAAKSFRPLPLAIDQYRDKINAN